MAELQRAFAQQGLKAGERLPPERELARQLSVGRSSLREAMQGLQTMGFVEVRRDVGIFFTSEPGKWLLSPLKFARTPSRRLLAELIEARLLVEVRLAEWAAERATERGHRASAPDRARGPPPGMGSTSNAASTFISRLPRPRTTPYSHRC